MIANRLKSKLDHIKRGDYQPTDFIIADAKDADMAFGIAAPGPDHSVTNSSQEKGRTEYKSRADYLGAMKDMARSELIDILLMSASSAETLHAENLFTDSQITPAVRLNDTTDI